MPEPEPLAIRVHFVASPICIRDVACAQRSRVGYREDALQLAAQFAALLPSVNPDPQKGISVHNEVAYGQH